MKLLYTSNSDLSSPSAERTHVTEIVNGLAIEGFDVHLTALMKRPYPTFHEAVRLHGILPAFNRIPFSILSNKIQRFQATKLVESILRKKGIDIVYERQGCNLALIPARRLGIPFVMEINGVPSIESRKLLSDMEKRRIDEDWIATFQSADGIVAVSSGIKDFLIESGVDEKRVRVIINGVNTEIFRPMNRQECRRAVGISENARVAIFVGNFRPYHNLELLIKSVRNIVRRVPEYLLVIVGDSVGNNGKVHHPTIEYLKKLTINEGVNSHVRFVGRLDQVDLPVYLNAADIGISLSNALQSPLKNAEYMACGLPIIFSTASAENLEEEMIGISVELNETSITESIVELLSNDQQREDIGSRALNLVRMRFSWKLKSQETASLLREVIDGI